MAVPTPLRIDTSSEPPVPPIAALFLVNFDNRKGYTLGWHRSIEDVQIEGVVEFKSLPSGLHNVEEDLIYFIHEDYAGLSAFVNKPDEHSERAARMLAVGVLVPLEHGRIGRSWRHAVILKELARLTAGRAQMDDLKNTTALEDYWDKHKLTPGDQGAQPSVEVNGQQTNGYRKSRSMSTATTSIPPHHSLMPHHPALTLLDALRGFGPLIFPLYRAALLRKRILIVTDTPVESSCNLVYNMSIISSISRSLSSPFPDTEASAAWLQPLFTVGVMDIPQLEQTKSWIACTTDDVLSTKPQLYDVLVLMPPSEIKTASKKAFPRIVHSTPELSKSFPRTCIRASQRDYHRFVHLRQGLRRYPPCQVAINGVDESGNDDTLSTSSSESAYDENKAVVEPPSWPRAAYTSLVWWASAGDRRYGLTDSEEAEIEQDKSFIPDGEDDQTREVALVAFFHRMTEAIFGTITAALARADGQDPEEEYHDEDDHDESPIDQTSMEQTTPVEEEETRGLLPTQGEKAEVDITQEDMAAMGLDSWIASDKRFVEEFVYLWWGRKAVVHAAVIECCGLRIL
ncbi:hypothetical protein LTR23_004323 [Exophiala sp. CCFEE 6169]|nr:hypothetical protein LTR23_004323 [Chaetothyriales sp. CCFEE 6169]